MALKQAFWGAAALIAASAIPAMATTVEFGTPTWVYNNTDPDEQVAWNVLIDDDASGKLTFAVSIDTGTTSSGDILGFGFDVDNNESDLVGLTSTDFTLTQPSGGSIGNFATGSKVCGSGCNFNGSDGNGDSIDAFDYIFSVGSTGSSGGGVTSFEFTVDVSSGFMLSTDTIERVGIRAQSVGVGTNPGGSAKDLNFTAEEVMSPVPLPAAAWLMLAALGGLGALRLRKSA